MKPIQHAINKRPFTSLAPLTEELVYQSDKNYLFDVSYLSSLAIIGEKGHDFLQGQLSCDLREVNHQQIRQGALCNLKGRILALLDVLHWDNHGLYLILPHDILLETQASLAKTAPFSRVTLETTSQYSLFGFYLQNPDDIIPFDLKLPTNQYEVAYQNACCCYHLGNHFYIFLVDEAKMPGLCDQFIEKKQYRGSLAWHALQLQQKHIEIYPQSRGLFLPHRLDLHLSGYLSFNKGCYKGQEIIARTHYRGTLKHELKVFYLESQETLQSGQRILSANGQEELGEIIDFCPVGGLQFLIAASVRFECPLTVRIENQNDPVILIPR